MNVNYLRTLTETEVKEWHEELDEFWKNLDWSIKNKIVDLLEPLIQPTCKHKWIERKNVFNDWEEMYCKKCHLKKLKSQENNKSK
jgi:hypothetical protein